MHNLSLIIIYHAGAEHVATSINAENKRVIQNKSIYICMWMGHFIPPGIKKHTMKFKRNEMKNERKNTSITMNRENNTKKKSQ